MKTRSDFTDAGVLLFLLACLVVPLAGWITNLAWLLAQRDVAMVVLGVAGFILPPLGALHGIYLWF